MKKIDYISPSGYMCYKRNPQEFYIRYLAEKRSTRDPETNAMAVGTAFDRRLKSQISLACFGKDQFKDDESTISDANKDASTKAGEHIFTEYVESGAFRDLLSKLDRSPIPIIMEKELRCTVGDVTILGKPDLAYATPHLLPVLLDFKVNGYCSKYAKSPNKGWYLLRSKPDLWQLKSDHKDCKLILIDTIPVNTALTLDQVYTDWAIQTTIYGWCIAALGLTRPVSPICQIEQIVSKPAEGGPILRFASHSCFVSENFKRELYIDLKHLWDICHSDWFFRDLTPEQSILRQESLDKYGDQLGTEMVDFDALEGTFA